MSDTLGPLILDFLEWIAAKPRPYSEVMDAWRTSCPRFTVWEDVVEQGFVIRRRDDAGLIVDLTPRGRSFLEGSERYSQCRSGARDSAYTSEIMKRDTDQGVPESVGPSIAAIAMSSSLSASDQGWQSASLSVRLREIERRPSCILRSLAASSAAWRGREQRRSSTGRSGRSHTWRRRTATSRCCVGRR